MFYFIRGFFCNVSSNHHFKQELISALPLVESRDLSVRGSKRLANVLSLFHVRVQDITKTTFHYITLFLITGNFKQPKNKGSVSSL